MTIHKLLGGAAGRRAQLAIVILLVVAVPALAIYFKYSGLVDKELQDGPFSDSVTFYSAPCTLVPGEKIGVSDVVAELRRAGYTERTMKGPGMYRVSGAAVEVEPGPDAMVGKTAARIEFEKDAIKSIVDLRTTQELEQVTLEPVVLGNVVSGERERRRLARYEEFPKRLLEAVVSVEDKRFFEHAGFDPYRLVKAVMVDLRYGRKEQGGSTITMQLARGLWLEPAKRWKRKAAEFLITTILEQKLSKRQILEYYCNQIYLGRRDTFSIHGFGEAARSYFNKEFSQLTLGESALLAGLIQRPSYYNPYRYPERARARRDVVLDLMAQNGYITPAARDTAMQEPVSVQRPGREAGEAPYFMALATDEVQTTVIDEQQTELNGLKVYTTLDPVLQRAAEDAVRYGMEEVDKRVLHKQKDGVLPQVALVAIDPHTGSVKAAVGGRNYGNSQLNHLLSLRQPGSVFKPFVYAAALNTGVERGSKVFTAESMVLDAPTVFRFAHEDYEPGNFGERYHGLVTLRNALAHSMNVATVRLAELVGYERVARMARKAGLKRAHATPAVALGAYEHTPVEVAGAYTAFANRGVWVHPTFLDRVVGNGGTVLLGEHIERRPAMDPRVAYLTTTMLEDVMRYGTAAGSRSRGFSAQAAGKTGTSRDGWFAGFTSDLLCVVWVGFDDNRELELEGAHSALPIWTEFMKRAVTAVPSRSEWNPRPAGIVAVGVNSLTGQLISPDCPGGRTDFYIQGTEPHTQCSAESLMIAMANAEEAAKKANPDQEQAVPALGVPPMPNAVPPPGAAAAPGAPVPVATPAASVANTADRPAAGAPAATGAANRVKKEPGR
jgi:penicillin-binding protein 1B